MKDFNLLVWLTQLGLSVAAAPILLILLTVWLRNTLELGSWVIWIAVVLSIYCAVTGLVSSVRTLQRISGKQDDAPPPVAFNDHS